MKRNVSFGPNKPVCFRFIVEENSTRETVRSSRVKTRIRPQMTMNVFRLRGPERKTLRTVVPSAEHRSCHSGQRTTLRTEVSSCSIIDNDSCMIDCKRRRSLLFSPQWEAMSSIFRQFFYDCILNFSFLL